jgi:hypothetical protein
MSVDVLSSPRRGSYAEGIFLTSTMSGVPTFAGAAMLLKLFNSGSGLADHPLAFVIATSIGFAFLVAYLGPKFPMLSKSSYEPLFFDGSLSFTDKVSRWLAETRTAQRLLTNALMLAVLGMAVMGLH